MRMIFSILFLSAAGLAKPGNPLVSAAEFYYQQNDYPRALAHWEKVLEAEPYNVNAICRVAELGLWIEGRGQVADRFLTVLEKTPLRLPRESRTFLKNKFLELQTRFRSDQAQNLYLQAKHRRQRGDLRGALDLLERASQQDRGQFEVLRERARVERQMGSTDQAHETLRLAMRSYPYDPATVTMLADTLLQQKDYKGAVELFDTTEVALSSHNRAQQAEARKQLAAAREGTPPVPVP